MSKSILDRLENLNRAAISREWYPLFGPEHPLIFDPMNPFKIEHWSDLVCGQYVINDIIADNFEQSAATAQLMAEMKNHIEKLLALAKSVIIYRNCVNYIPTDEKMAEVKRQQLELVSNEMLEKLAELEKTE